MMDCNTYRRALMADPHDPDPQLREHRASCPECNLFSERQLSFESRLERALRVPIRAESSRPPMRAAAYRRGWLAMAASVLLAVVVAGGLWLAVPHASLAADVATHMGGEPDSWRPTEAVPASALEDVLRNTHLRLAAGTAVVSYAASCEFRGHHVPHLVVQTEAGPVTVMVLVHENVAKTVDFDEQGYRGVLVPVAGHGSLAVLTRGSATDIKSIEHIAARVRDSIEWTG
jgi:hypothetical protein